jgi:peptide subunit release factor 1 (eRF1)
MKLKRLLDTLVSYEPDGTPFITLYINAESNENGRETYLTWVKNELSERSTEYQEESPEALAFAETVEKIQNFLEKESENSAEGIAVFAQVGGEFFATGQLDVAFPHNRFFLFDRPHIFPLVRALEQNPAYAVLWADTNKADIYLFGGERWLDTEINAETQVEEIKNAVTARTKAGGWSQARYQRRMENLHSHHAKETAEALEKIMRERKIEHLVLCGDKTTIMPHLRPQLSKATEELIVDSLHMSQYNSEEEIYEATQEVMRNFNVANDIKTVERVIGSTKAAAKLGTLGVDKTLAALSNGQVEELVISATFDGIEYSPKKVEKVLKAYAPGDDNSTSDELPEVREPRLIGDELLIRALNSAAKIKFIEDESLLSEAGGVGAVLRYNMNATANG